MPLTLTEVIDAMGISEELAAEAAKLFDGAVAEQVEEVVQRLDEIVDGRFQELTEDNEDLRSTVDDLLQVITGSNAERDAALRRIAVRARARAVDAHDDDWGKEAPGDADRNRKSVRGKKQGDDGYGETQEDVEQHKEEEAQEILEVSRYAAAISKAARRGY